MCVTTLLYLVHIGWERALKKEESFYVVINLQIYDKNSWQKAMKAVIIVVIIVYIAVLLLLFCLVDVE